MTSTSHRRARAPRSAAEIARTATGPRPLPPLTATRGQRAPAMADVTGANGLRVVTVRRARTPMVELRLRIPFAGTGRAHSARAELLAETMLLGTGRRSREQVDIDLAEVGGQLGAQVNPQRLLITGSVLAPGLPTLLEVLGDVLTDAAYRPADVGRERERLVEHLLVNAAQPAVIARKHLQRYRFGSHPAAREVPPAEAVAAVAPAAVRTLHRRSLTPDGAQLVLVGDVQPERAAEQASAALAGWAGEGSARVLTTPGHPAARPIEIHSRPGAVQSQTRLTSRTVPRDDPDYPAAKLANVIFGGYFSSRLVENLREDKGYTYHAYSTFEFWPGLGAVTIGYDTATDVTAAALMETRHELARMALRAPSDSELESARNYAAGSLAASLATQTGYASLLSTLLAAGVGSEWLREHPRRLAAVSIDDVMAAGRRLFAPAAVSGVIVGDADAIVDDLLLLGGVEPVDGGGDDD